jgi:hypothetical protein
VLITDKLRSYACAYRRLRLTCAHQQGCAKTIGPKTRIRQSGDASASCSGSSRLDLPSVPSAFTPVHNTFILQRHLLSRSHIADSEQKLPNSGKMPSQRHNAW